jgi:arylsulfatase A-like enzyme
MKTNSLVLTATAVLFATVQNATAQDKPNILFIMGEDASAEHFGIYGNKTVQTPNIDALGRAGIVFRNAFATSPQCSPTKASILTGLMPWMLDHPIVDHRLRFNVKFKSYAEFCEQAGYRTGQCGKGGWKRAYNNNPGPRGKNPAGESFNSFSDFLESHPEGKPFCFWAGYGEAHRPFKNGSLDTDTFDLPPYLPDSPEIRKDIGGYLKELQMLDDRVGKDVRLLKERGLFENTLIVLMPGDHGWPFPRGKCNLYDSGTKIQMILHWSGKIGGGRRCSDLVSAVDVFATVLEAAGIDIPDDCLGKSLLPLALSEDSGSIDPSRNSVYIARGMHNSYYPSRAVRTREFLYIRNFRSDLDPIGANFSEGIDRSLYPVLRENQNAALFEMSFGERPEEELYEVKSDPHQLRNLADNPDFESVKKELAASLHAFQQRTHDPLLEHLGQIDATELNYVR